MPTMAWYEAHQTMAKHPKTLKLARLLKVDRRYAVGLLHDLFSWALDVAQKYGELHDLTAEDIAAALDIPGKKGLATVDALVESGYLEKDGENYSIHDWYDYAGRLSERREEEKAYAKRKYNLYNDMRLIKQVRERDGDFCRYCGKLVNWKDRKGADGGTYDHVNPDGENLLDNIVVACRSCNSKKRDRTPEQANMPLIPVGFTADNTVDSGRFTADKGQKKSAITVPNLTIGSSILQGTSPTCVYNPTAHAHTRTREDDDGYGLFLAAWPKISGRPEANYFAYRQALDGGATLDEMLAALEWLRESPGWQENGGQFIPSPERWLKNRGWTQKKPEAEGGGGNSFLDIYKELKNDA